MYVITGVRGKVLSLGQKHCFGGMLKIASGQPDSWDSDTEEVPPTHQPSGQRK